MAFFKKFRKDLKTTKDAKTKNDIGEWLQKRQDILYDADERIFEMEDWLGLLSPRLQSIKERVKLIRKAAHPSLTTGQSELAIYKKCVATMKRESEKLLREEMALFKACHKLAANQYSHMMLWMEENKHLEDKVVKKVWDAAEENKDWCDGLVRGEHRDDEIYKWRRMAWLNHLFKIALDEVGIRLELTAVEGYLGKAMTEPV